MPSSRAVRLAALGLALGLTACRRSDPDVQPYRLRFSVQSGGPALPTPELSPLVALTGPVTRLAARELVVNDAVRGPVSVTLEAPGSPELVFPAQLAGAEVQVAALYVEGLTAPDGSPLAYPAMRVGLVQDQVNTFQLVVVSSPLQDARDLAATPVPIGRVTALGDLPAPAFPDFPDFLVLPSSTRFELGECGLIYHDVLSVIGADGEILLHAGERAAVVTVAGQEPWTVLHVDSWHRTGSCGARAKVWTQFAAWR